MKDINLSVIPHIARILKRYKTRAKRYSYSPAKTILWFWKQPEKFVFDSFGTTDYTREEILKQKDILVEGNVVYIKPHVILVMSSGDNDVRYFQTDAEMEAFVDNLNKLGVKTI